MRKVSYLSYNMTTADANNPDGIVPVGRQFDFIGDVETEEMILVDGDESFALATQAYSATKMYVGDMMEYKATLTNHRQYIKETATSSIQTCGSTA